MSTAFVSAATSNANNPFWNQVASVRARVAEAKKVSEIGREYVYITSESDPYKGQVGGATVEAELEVAAQCLARRTHRLSSTAEIEKYHADQQARAEVCQRLEEKNKEKTVLKIDRDALRAMVDMAGSEDPPKTVKKNQVPQG